MPRLAPAPKPPTPAQLAAREANGKRLADASRRRAQLASVRKMVETSEQKIGQDHPRDLSSTGPAKLEPAIIQPVEKPVSGEKLAMLVFMEEKMVILIHDSTNPTDDPVPVVWNDGISQYFQRGVEQEVKRKFVERLARMKKTVYGQEKILDSQGNETYRQIPKTGLVFPFAVVRDDNPRGAAWLKAVLAEA